MPGPPIADGWAGRGVERAQAMLGGGPWEATTLHGTGGAQYGSSVARLRSGGDSVIVKVIRRNDAAPHDPTYWRRELDVYRSDWLAESLPAGLAIPVCLASDLGDESAVIVMEDMLFDDRDARPPDWYGRLARLLAQLNARASADVPTWASRGFVTSEAAHVLEVVPDLTARPTPHMVDLVDRWRPLFERLLDAMPVLLERLERWPEGFGHLDAFSRNAASIGDRIVMIDWAYAGVAPVGTDAAGIVGMTGMHGDVTGDDLGRLYRVVVDEYTAGLHSSGLELDPADVEATVELLLVLRWTGFMTQIHALGDRLVEIAEAVGGRPFAHIAAAWAALSELVATLAESVLDRAEV